MLDYYNFLILAKQYAHRFTKYFINHFFCMIKISLNNITNNPRKNHDIFVRMIKENQLSRERINTYKQIKKNHNFIKFLGVNPNKDFFKNLHSIVLFIGYSRSGHSLVGSLLDAHPEILISHELHMVKQLLSGSSESDIFKSMVINSALFNKNGREYTGYNYSVTDQYQGKVTTLKLLGDKKGNGTVRLIKKHPKIILLLKRLRVPVKFIHVIRNPYDNIATRATRNGTSLSFAAKGYFKNMEVISKIDQGDSFEVEHIFLEDLICQPALTLTGLLDSLNIAKPTDEYIQACSKMLFSRPKETRFDWEWSSSLVDYVSQKIEHYAFLERFQECSFDNRLRKIEQ